VDHLVIQVCGVATTLVCGAWVGKSGAEVLTEEPFEGEKLHRIKQQRVDRVLVYFYCRHAPILLLYCYTEGSRDCPAQILCVFVLVMGDDASR
jgi:hypothetical protein